MRTSRQITTHSFLIEDAEKYGVTCAVLLFHVRYWTDENRFHNINYHNGRYWTFSSVKNLHEKYPYLTEKQISSHLSKLEALGVLVSDNFNKSTYDRTKWYSLNEEEPAANPDGQPFDQMGKCILPNGNMHFTETDPSILPNGKMDLTEKENRFPEKVEPIPLTNKINKEIKNDDEGEIFKFSKEKVFNNSGLILDIKKTYGLDQKQIESKLDYFVARKKLENKVWTDQIDFNLNFFDWLRFEIPTPEIKPAAAAKKTKKDPQRALLLIRYKKQIRYFVEQLQADATALENARIKFNKECQYPKEFNSQAVYNALIDYEIKTQAEPDKIPDNILEKLTFAEFKRNFFTWFKKQKHGDYLFSNTPNGAKNFALVK